MSIRNSPSFALLGNSWSFVRVNKDLLLFPVLSFVGLSCILAAFSMEILRELVYQTGTHADEFPSLARIATVFLFWFCIVFNFIFFNAACLAVVYKRMILNEQASLGSGVGVAFGRIAPLAGWSALWACGITILYFAARWLERYRWVQHILVVVIEIFNTLSWFVLPSILVEKKGLWSAMKNSTSLFRNNWGKTVVIRYSVGACFALAYVMGLGLMMLAAAAASSLESAGLITMDTAGNVVASVFFGFIALFLLGLLVQSVFNAVARIALYHYALTGQIAQGFDREILLSSVGQKPHSILGL